MPNVLKTKPLRKTGIYRPSQTRHTFFSAYICICVVIFLSACTELEKPKGEAFFAETAPPAKQEFRWSNGKLPKSFDPARASAAPETDVVRALFEGLTETDPKTLQEAPGVAEKWSSSDNFRTWRFYLRPEAKWSNGTPVTAQDFVRSWQRLAEMGERAAHNDLLNNIVGFPLKQSDAQSSSEDSEDFLLNSITNKSVPLLDQAGDTDANSKAGRPQKRNAANSNSIEPFHRPDTANDENKTKPGFTAENERVLKVMLKSPDRDFPKLIANPIFRPVYGVGREFETSKLDKAVVTNGAFRLVGIGKEGITLERSENYWNRENVALELVRFVPMETAEDALKAYQAGELDAVTNAEFAPLVVKLLSPYGDFRRTTHSALNFYEVNSDKPPFSDRRVRQALSNAIERERLTEGETEGLTRPALSFLPFGTRTKLKLSQDKERARELLDEAGFPSGENFPVIKLVVNRNDTQQRIARSVARMWKQNLNLETEILVKDNAELELARKTGDFDLIRRGVVLPTIDEAASFMAIFKSPHEPGEEPVEVIDRTRSAPDGQMAGPPDSNSAMNEIEPQTTGETAFEDKSKNLVLTEEAAILDLHAIPLYFPTSHSLVKPYVYGFEMNSLDALSLSNVLIDNNWQPKTANGES